MAVITSAQTGSWASSSTWVGGSVPTTADDVVVDVGHVVTIDSEVQRAANTTTTVNGTLDVGDTSQTLGTLVVADGAIFNGTGTVRSNKSKYSWLGTASNPIIVSGSLSFEDGTQSPAYNNMELDIEYVNFTTTGNILFSIYMLGAVNKCRVKHVYAKGCGYFYLGSENWTSANQNFDVTDNVFEDLTGFYPVRFNGRALMTSDVYNFNRNIFRDTSESSASYVRMTMYHSDAVKNANALNESVCINYGMYFSHGSQKKEKILFLKTNTNGSEHGLTEGGQYKACYFYDPNWNPHVIDNKPAVVDSCVSEMPLDTSASEGNLVVVSDSHDCIVRYNVGIGPVHNMVGTTNCDGTGKKWEIYSNTQYTTRAVPHNNFLLLEADTDLGVEVEMYNNIDYCADANRLYHVNSIAIGKTTTLSICDKNAYYNASTPLRSITSVTDGDGGFSFNTQFFDPTRNILGWCAMETGIESPVITDVVDLFLKRIGFDDAANKFTATTNDSSVADLVSWVRDGYATTSVDLVDAGRDGVTIGAMGYVSPDTTAPVLTDATATATGPTTATASVTTDDGNGTLYFLASTNATESAATVKAALSQSVTADGEQSISLSALDPETTYYVHFVQINGASLESASVVTTGAITTPAIVYPEISATAAASSTSAVSATVTTDTAGGTIYGVLSESATGMEAEDIKSGADDTATVADAGDYTLDETGLATWTQYYWHIVHEDADGLMSNVLTIPVRTLDISIPFAFSDTAPATLLGVQVWSKVPKKADVEGLY